MYLTNRHGLHLSFLALLCLLLGYAGDSIASAEAAEEASPDAASYVALEPPFVVNVDDNGRVRFLQANVQLSVRGPGGAGFIEEHRGPIRHALIMLLSGQQVSELRTLQGKTALREAALKEIQAFLKDYKDAPTVDAVFFTGFIIQ